ncbi:hypothetical protein [Actinomadura latina]|uniref:Uncharacterized protein n=1 Tax=Actinomadura latina TaxID=163603 RepID=A0A846YTX9_9ACTN|nr:hypothetical protein [Actinomadura latina]NKZ04330.1 hypothetical protein [Actinomadura latina]
MTSWKALPAAAAAVLLAAGLASPAAAATRGDFTPVSLPFFWPNNYLYDLDAASPDSVWIAGTQGELVVPGPIPGSGTTLPGNPVVRRWKNARWVEYPLQNLDSRGSITDVDAAGPEDVWISGFRYAVGDAYPTTFPYLAHFTGAGFEQVSLPSGARNATLQASAAGVWVSTGSGVYRRTGDAWTQITALPDMDRNTSYIRADDDIWVLGRVSQTDQTLMAQHWDGQSWTSVPVHEPSVAGAGFTDMIALSPTDAWATGISYTTSPATPVLMHWDGTAWTSVTPPSGLNALTRIIKSEAGTLWALGHDLDEPAKPALLRYSGGTWEQVPTTAVPNRSNIYATALAAVPGTGALWTLGSVNIGGPVVLTDG